jgi:hypothetical protein
MPFLTDHLRFSITSLYLKIETSFCDLSKVRAREFFLPHHVNLVDFTLYVNTNKWTLTVHLISHFTLTCFGVHDAILRENTKFKIICWLTRRLIVILSSVAALISLHMRGV